MKRIRADRVALALTNLGVWKGRVQAQGSTHLFPLIALLGAGAGDKVGATPFNETPDEFEFWNRYFRLEDDDTTKPYFNPVTLRRAEAGFPHSNSATIRKNTFAGKWHAATRTTEDDRDSWTLSDDYADIFRDKVLRKGTSTSRVPVVDVAALMLRAEAFDEDANARTLEARFRELFPQHEDDYEKLFVFHDEEPERIFVDAAIDQDYQAAIKSRLVDDVRTAASIPTAPSQATQMDLNDPVLVQVQRLLTFGTSGIILSGVPGTGKSYYAKRIAKHLVKNPDTDIFRVQFHPSYGYEDFVEGYRPEEGTVSGYKVVDKTFLEACERANETALQDNLVVVIVDEINRGDPARVFGELLTYIERDYRGEQFILPFSGKPARIPGNLIILGTMNPFDRSIAPVDAAFVRRFDHIEVGPSREVAEQLLEDGQGFTPDQVGFIGDWFETAQRLLPFGLGHSFFSGVTNLDDLMLVWRYRMKPAAELAVELEDGRIEHLTASFEALVRRLEGAADDG